MNELALSQLPKPILDELKAFIATEQEQAEQDRVLPDADQSFIDGFQAGMEWVLLKVTGI